MPYRRKCVNYTNINITIVISICKVQRDLALVFVKITQTSCILFMYTFSVTSRYYYQEHDNNDLGLMRIGYWLEVYVNRSIVH